MNNASPPVIKPKLPPNAVKKQRRAGTVELNVNVSKDKEKEIDT